MNDEKIEQAINGLLEVAASNFPSDTDIVISTSGRNTASIRISSYALAGIMAMAKETRERRRKSAISA